MPIQPLDTARTPDEFPELQVRNITTLTRQQRQAAPHAGRPVQARHLARPLATGIPVSGASGEVWSFVVQPLSAVKDLKGVAGTYIVARSAQAMRGRSDGGLGGVPGFGFVYVGEAADIGQCPHLQEFGGFFRLYYADVLLVHATVTVAVDTALRRRIASQIDAGHRPPVNSLRRR